MADSQGDDHVIPTRHRIGTGSKVTDAQFASDAFSERLGASAERAGMDPQ